MELRKRENVRFENAVVNINFLSYNMHLYCNRLIVCVD